MDRLKEPCLVLTMVKQMSTAKSSVETLDLLMRKVQATGLLRDRQKGMGIRKEPLMVRQIAME